MAQQIRILLVEDDPRDAQDVMAELGRADFSSEILHVTERQSVQAALEQGKWDLILSDFSLPDMTALDLLRWLKELKLDVPVIVISSTIGEETAVHTMHAGAHDYINKDSLARLNPAIERELQEMEVHRQRWLAEAALVESEQNFRQLTETIPEVFWLIDCQMQQMVYLSPAFESVWEQPAALVMAEPQQLLNTMHPEDHERIRELIDKQGWQGLKAEYRILLPDGQQRWINTRSFPIYDAAGKVVRIAGLSSDITENMCLRQEREMMSRALEQTADAVMITDAEGNIVYVNRAFEDLTGFDSNEVLGKNPRLLKSGFQDEAIYQAMWSNITNGIPYSDIFINRRKDGELYYEAKTITPIRNHEGVVSHFISTAKDITDRLKTRERLNKLVNYDAVTGLANRILLQDRLGQAVIRYKRQKCGFGLICVSVELKELLGEGHDTKMLEQLLRQISQRIGSCVDGQDTVASMGSGEFMILHRDHDHATEQMEVLAQNLLTAFSTPVSSDGYELFVTPAIGISLFNAEIKEPEILMEQAKIAMEHSRKKGHGGYSFYQGGSMAYSRGLSS